MARGVSRLAFLEREERGRVNNHSIKVSDRIGDRSLMNRAAAPPVIHVMMPRILKAQAGLICWIIVFITRLITAPPTPPPAQTIPLAKPRFL